MPLTRRIGCMVPMRTESVRLYAPPMQAEGWLVLDDRGDLKLERGEVRFEIIANQVATATIELPQR